MDEDDAIGEVSEEVVDLDVARFELAVEPFAECLLCANR